MNDEHEPFVPTEREAQVANVLGGLCAVLGFVAIALFAVTGVWWPPAMVVGLAIVMVFGCTAWAARSRHQGFLTTVQQIIRTQQQRA